MIALRRKLLSFFVLALGIAGLVPQAGAVLTIKITHGVEGAIPIAIVPFGWDGTDASVPEDIGAVVTADLARSGRFDALPIGDLPARPHDGSAINFRNWRMLGTEFLLVGRIVRQPIKDYVLEFQLFDVFKGVQLVGYSMPAREDELRHKAHQISDMVYEKLTGQRGAFTTRIAYVTVTNARDRNARFSLRVADADGFNPQILVDSKQPLMSPAWSPDGSRLAYVSFEGKASAVYVQALDTGRRELISVGGDAVSAPAWSPDGKRLALAVTRAGNPDIYAYDFAGGKAQRLTDNSAIDTEPAWSPDGRDIVFTSDRGGQPQIYSMPARGGPARRLTFEGSYNARATWSPDGRLLAMVHGQDGRYRIAVLDVEHGLVQVLTSASLDESPSFAPNGAMIIYATQTGAGAELAAVSVDGRVRQSLVLDEGDVREPVWSPFK